MGLFSNVNRGFHPLFDFTPLPRSVQVYLRQVCFALFLALVASSIGIYLHSLWNIGGLPTTLGYVGTMGRLYHISMIPQTTERMRVRVPLLMVATLFYGASAYAGLKFFVAASRRSTIRLLFGAAIGFGRLSSLNNIYPVSLFFSGTLAILFWSSLSSAIFGTSVVGFGFEFELYLALLLHAVLFVMYCKRMINQALHGVVNHVLHAFNVFLHISFIAGLIFSTLAVEEHNT